MGSNPTPRTSTLFPTELGCIWRCPPGAIRAKDDMNIRPDAKPELLMLKPLQVALGSLYFIFFAYLAYYSVAEIQMAMNPRAYVPDYLMLLMLGSTLTWAGLTLFQLKGYHRHNIPGSILSMLLVSTFFFEDQHIGTNEVLLLLLFLAAGLLSLNDLRRLPDRRIFSAILLVDALLLLFSSAIAYRSWSVQGFPEAAAAAGILGGLAMLCFGVFRLVRPRIGSTLPSRAPRKGPR